MKRKFSFNLAPVKLSAKSDTGDKQAPEPTPSHSHSSSQSHRRHASKDSISDYSPYINRRILDADTELELRVACRLILQNFKPSDHGMENTDPKLDFGAMQRRKEQQKEHKPQTSELKVRMPTGAPPELTSNFVARKPSTKTRTRAKADMEIRTRTQGDLPARANSSRKRADFGWLDDRDDKREQNLRKLGKSPSMDIPRSATLHVDGDSGVSTPVTVSSTLAYSKQASTAPTSASLTSSGSSNRRSRQLDNPAAVADAQAAEWMRQELEKKKKEEASQLQARPSTAVRPPSRSASIRNGIKEYVFPGTRSRALSRAQSQDSLRTTDTAGSQDPSQDPQRSGSASGWRSWGLPRRSGSRSNSRPGTSRGQSDEPEESKKSEPKVVNLNRDLPPLPSLDTWKEPEQPKEEMAKSPKSPTSAAHIASLMRPQEQTQEPSPARGREHRRSRSDGLALHYANAYPIRKSSHNKHQLQAPPQPTRAAPGGESTMTGCSSTSNLNNHLEPGSRSHTRQRSGDSLTSPTSPNGTSSLEVPMSFTRKLSMDTPSRRTLSNEVKTSRREEQKSRLKKVFSGWMSKKEKKDDWMHRIEKEGVKEGVLVQDGTNVAPVVRY